MLRPLPRAHGRLGRHGQGADGLPGRRRLAGFPASSICVSVMTSTDMFTARVAASMAAAIPHGKMMLGPMAANVAKNSLTISTSRISAWRTLALTVVETGSQIVCLC